MPVPLNLALFGLQNLFNASFLVQIKIFPIAGFPSISTAAAVQTSKTATSLTLHSLQHQIDVRGHHHGTPTNQLYSGFQSLMVYWIQPAYTLDSAIYHTCVASASNAHMVKVKRAKVGSKAFSSSSCMSVGRSWVDLVKQILAPRNGLACRPMLICRVAGLIPALLISS